MITIIDTDLIPCTYGHLEPNHDECFVATLSNGMKAYCINDSVNVNFTYDSIESGCHVELLEDVDCSTANEPVDGETRFIREVQMHIDYLNEQDEE